MALDIGRVAYEGYCESFGELPLGDELPRWEEIGKRFQDAWRLAAVAVLASVEKDLDCIQDED